MKVGLICFHTFSIPGGVKRHILGLNKELKARGVKTKIIVPRRSQSEDYGPDVILLGTSFPLNAGGTQGDLNVNFNPLSIQQVLIKEKFDVLHFHNFGFPSIMQILLTPAAFESVNVLTWHANLQATEFMKNIVRLLKPINKACEWTIDGIIGVAPLVLDYFPDYTGPKKVIPNGIDLQDFNANVPLLKKFSDGKTNILFVGRIDERKGLIYLLRAFKILEKKFSNLRLIVVGSGPMAKECKEYAKNNLKNVVFEGQIADKGILASYYKTADIYVSPAIFGESFGLVLLESMACGTPLVAFANQGYEQLLRDKASGKFLVQPKDYKGLAEKIGILIQDPELRKQLAEQGLKEVTQYSWTKVTDQVMDFYKTAAEYKKQRDAKHLYINKILKRINNFKV